MVKINEKKELSLKEKYERLERELREKNRELESSKFRYKEKKYAGRRVEEEVKQSKQETENIKKTFAKELEEKDLLIENKEEERAQWELDARTHFEALTETSKEWNEKKLKWWVEVFYKKLLDLNTVRNWTIEYNEKLHDVKTKCLEDEVSSKSKEIKEKSEDLKIKSRILEETNLIVGEQKERIRWLEEELEKKTKRLAEANQIILEEKSQNKNLQEQLCSVNNSSRKRKRENEVEQEGRKKVELQKLFEENELQELITNIEVSTKHNN